MFREVLCEGYNIKGDYTSQILLMRTLEGSVYSFYTSWDDFGGPSYAKTRSAVTEELSALFTQDVKKSPDRRYRYGQA